MGDEGIRRWPAVLAAAAGSVLVGTMPLVARHLYADGLGAPSMLLWRYALALVVLAAAIRVRRLSLRQAWRRGIWQVAAVGATLGAGQTLCYWESIKTLETSTAVLLFYTYPVATLLIERLFFKQRIRPLAVLCSSAILAGAALVTEPGLKSGSLDPRGLMWAIPGPLIYAVYLAMTARMLRRYPALLGAGSLFAGIGLSFALAVGLTGLDVPRSGVSWLLVLFIALGPGALWMILFSYSAPRLGAASYAIVANTELITVVAIGTLVLGEPVTPSRALGGALVLAGILVHALSRQAAPPVLAASSAGTEREAASPAGAGG